MKKSAHKIGINSQNERIFSTVSSTGKKSNEHADVADVSDNR